MHPPQTHTHTHTHTYTHTHTHTHNQASSESGCTLPPSAYVSIRQHSSAYVSTLTEVLILRLGNAAPVVAHLNLFQAILLQFNVYMHTDTNDEENLHRSAGALPHCKQETEAHALLLLCAVGHGHM